MSAAQLLDALRQRGLGHYYLSLTMKGIHSLESLAKVETGQLKELDIKESDRSAAQELINEVRKH
jgi:hypothetical protein